MSVENHSDNGLGQIFDMGPRNLACASRLAEVRALDPEVDHERHPPSELQATVCTL